MGGIPPDQDNFLTNDEKIAARYSEFKNRIIFAAFNTSIDANFNPFGYCSTHHFPGKIKLNQTPGPGNWSVIFLLTTVHAQYTDQTFLSHFRGTSKHLIIRPKNKGTEFGL
jgi:hypothetical protein